eukprot:CAMPEP_0118988100 /NCGR_PEP_ID=MMETSP1173-20130426/45552_1 /TAXON_ID=1034831 /ORGANISM="Rhizochromulina marina cf, Strain CCMP1243" /LENGTH=75 /DNA_ID=CAMNT_0006939011 /DNA_START=15 /DNA_END=238 /DNA_ORIENTATION=-
MKVPWRSALRSCSSTSGGAAAPPRVVGSHKSFGGVWTRYEHESAATGTPMTFSVFLPPRAAAGPVPCVFYLSGLT